MPRRRIRTTTTGYIYFAAWLRFLFSTPAVQGERGTTYNRGKKKERKGKGKKRNEEETKFGGKKVSVTFLVLSRLLDLIP